MPSILLVIPPSPFLLEERVFMPLGVLKVAASLEQAGIPFRVLDLAGHAHDAEALLASAMQQFNPTHIGFTSTTPQLPVTVSLARFVRRTDPNVRRILGGPHGTLTHAAVNKARKLQLEHARAYHAWSKLELEFDTIVVGDGELAILEALSNDKPLVDADSTNSPYWMSESRLAQAPWPARQLLDVGSYHYSIDGRRSLSLIAQLGCPFNCGFCGGRESASLRVARFRDAQNVIAEVRHVYDQFGVTGFMFYDDELNISEPRLLELCHGLTELQDKLGVDFKLRGFVKAQLFTATQAKALKAAGMHQLLVGFESGSDRILRNINKKSTKIQNTRCLELARQAGLTVKALMSLGHPGESAETVHETEQWLCATAPEDLDVTVITCYPGTPYYDQARPAVTDGHWTYRCPSGDVLHQVDVDYLTTMDYYKGVPGSGYHAYVYTDFLAQADLVAAREHLDQTVRTKLGIAQVTRQHEHSMGQS